MTVIRKRRRPFATPNPARQDGARGVIGDNMAHRTGSIGLSFIRCYPDNMSEDELILAIGRLERAVSRLEQDMQASQAAARTVNPSDMGALEDSHISHAEYVPRAEYERLREAAEDAVSRIDRIIGAQSN